MGPLLPRAVGAVRGDRGASSVLGVGGANPVGYPYGTQPTERTMTRSKPPAERTGNEWRKKLVAPGNDAFVTPHPPASVNNIARWESIWALGGPTGVYNVRADFEIVARYCEYVERRATMTAILDAEGWTIEGNNGAIWPHPMARFVSDVEKKLGPIEDRLGLNPQARNTIAIGQVAMQSALEDWLDG